MLEFISTSVQLKGGEVHWAFVRVRTSTYQETRKSDVGQIYFRMTSGQLQLYIFLSHACWVLDLSYVGLFKLSL